MTLAQHLAELRRLGRRRGRVSAGVAGGLVAAAAVMLATASGSLAQSQESMAGGPDSWVATGDSYSAGVGTPGAEGDCVQATDRAYAGLVRQRLTAGAQSLDPWQFTACIGHLSRDLYNQRDSQDFHGPLWPTAALDGDKVELVTLTFGGNDIGFADVIFDCLGIEPGELQRGATTGSIVGAWTRSYGCDVTEDELVRRVRALGDPSLPLPGDAGHRLPGDSPGSLAELYRHIHDQHLTADGHLVVLGYPRLFAPSKEWDGWFNPVCSGFRRSDADMLRDIGHDLNAQIDSQVTAAAEGGRNIHYLPVAPAFDGHERCSDGDPFLHGLSLVNDGRGSFHPNPTGHFEMAELLDAQIQDLYQEQGVNQDSELAFDTCEREGTFRIGYPAKWWTNPFGEFGRCWAFHPKAAELEHENFSYAVKINITSMPLRRLIDDANASRTDLARRETTIGGRRAVVSETRVTGESSSVPHGALRYAYRIDLYAHTLSIETHSVGSTNYERDKRLIDRMVKTLELLPGAIPDGPSTVGRRFIRAWIDGDRESIKQLATERSAVRNALNNSPLTGHVEEGAISCFRFDSESNDYECDIEREGGGYWYVLITERQGEWRVRWAGMGHD